MKRFRGELVVKAYRLLYHSTLGSRVLKKKKKCDLARGITMCNEVGESILHVSRGLLLCLERGVGILLPNKRREHRTGPTGVPRS